jgi:hypothetical protein
MKVVRIQALAREGFPTRPRAGRFFPSGEAVTMEIVDGDEDPTVDVDKTDAAGKTYKATRPDPGRMSKKVFETMIMTDPVLRVLADGETVSDLSQAALDAARKSAGEHASKLAGAEAKVATLTEQLAKAKARITELEGQHGAAADESAKAEETEADAESDRSAKHSSVPRSRR